MENKIATYVLFAENADGTIPPTPTKDSIDREGALRLTSEDLLLKPNDFAGLREAGFVHIYRVLSKFAPKEMKEVRKKVLPDGQVVMDKKPEIPEVHFIGKKPSKLYTLPVLNLDETKVSNSADIY